MRFCANPQKYQTLVPAKISQLKVTAPFRLRCIWAVKSSFARDILRSVQISVAFQLANCACDYLQVRERTKVWETHSALSELYSEGRRCVYGSVINKNDFVEIKRMYIGVLISTKSFIYYLFVSFFLKASMLFTYTATAYLYREKP